MKSNTQLMEQISKMEPLDFAGLARLLGVQIVELDDTVDEKDKYKPRPFTDVFSEVMQNFDKLGRTRKREILKLIKKANSVHRGGTNASNTSNS